MTDRPDAPAETSLQRALRLKQEALQAQPRPPGPDIRPGRPAGQSAGASKPWMKR